MLGHRMTRPGDPSPTPQQHFQRDPAYLNLATMKTVLGTFKAPEA
jgi:hypothetical protein